MHERAKLLSKRPANNQRFKSSIKNQIQNDHRNQISSIKSNSKQQRIQQDATSYNTGVKQITSDSSQHQTMDIKYKTVSSQTTGIQIKQGALKMRQTKAEHHFVD